MYNLNPSTQLRICKAKSLYDSATPCTAGEMKEMMCSQYVKNICDLLKNLPQDEAHQKQRDALKRKLPVWCFGVSEFEDNIRKNENAKASGLALLDIDHVADPLAMVKSWGDPNMLHTCGVYMTSLSCSGTGIHLVIGVREGESIETAQERVARVLGISDYDKGCKDVARASFVVPTDYVLQFYADAFVADETESTTSVSAPAVTTTTPVSTQAQTIAQPEDTQDIEEPCYQGLPLKKLVEQILSSIMGLTTEPQEGDHTRHNYYMELLGYLRYVCDNQAEVMLKVAPSWGLPEEERRKMCQGAASYSYKKMPRALRRVIDQLKDEAAQAVRISSDNRHRPLPKSLPKLPRLILKMFPKQYHKQVIMASFPLLGTLTTGLRYQKDPYNEMGTTFMTYVYGPLASGKGFTRVLAEWILRPIIEEDMRAQEELQKWKDIKEANGNGKGPKRPHLILRQIFPDFTLAALNQQIIDAKEQHLIFFSEESDNFVMDKKFSAKLRESYDGVRTGQTRVSAQSVSGGARSNINMLTCGTPLALRKMMSNPEDGLVSRFNFVEMPASNGFERLVWSKLTERETKELEKIINDMYHIGLIKPTTEVTDNDLETESEEEEAKVAKFTQNTYEKKYVKLPRAERQIELWVEQLQAELDADPQKVALGRFARRIPDFMRRVALVLYACEGEMETDESLELMEWMGNEALQTMLDLYGHQYETICNEQNADSRAYLRNCKAADLYDLMPDHFSVNDLIAKRKQMGLSDNSVVANTTISRWKRRGMVRIDSINEQGQRCYVKVKMLEMGA